MLIIRLQRIVLCQCLLRWHQGDIFDIAICDFKKSNSSLVNWNMKSLGNRSILRFTCSFRRRVSTPYRKAKSESSITCCPLISRIIALMLTLSGLLYANDVISSSWFGVTSLRVSHFATSLGSPFSAVFFLTIMVFIDYVFPWLQSYTFSLEYPWIMQTICRFRVHVHNLLLNSSQSVFHTSPRSHTSINHSTLAPRVFPLLHPHHHT